MKRARRSPILSFLVISILSASGGGTLAATAPCAVPQPTDISTLDLGVKHRVRCVWFTPSDRPLRSCLQERLDVFVRMAQRFFQEEMAREGFLDAWGQGKTFPFEMDAAGRWKVVYMVGEQPASWYWAQWEGTFPGTPAFHEMNRRLPLEFARENVVLYIYDLVVMEGNRLFYCGQGGSGAPWSGEGAGYTLQGAHIFGVGFDTVATTIDEQGAMFEQTESSGLPDYDGNGSLHILTRGEYASTDLGAGIHELGHAFYLGHIFDDYDGDGIETNLMGNGFRRFSGRYTPKGYLPPTGLGPVQASELDTAVLFNEGTPPIELLRDDGDPGTSLVGTWKPSGGTYPYGDGSVYAWLAGASYTFDLAVPVPGAYSVALRWTSWPSRLAGVPVEIEHSGGKATVTVDQSRNGGTWNTVGTWTFGSTARITIRARDGGTTCADGVRLTRIFEVAPPPPAGIVLDNGQPGTKALGSWTISGAPDPWGTSSLYSKSAGASYAFTVPLPTPGTYEAQLWWTQWPSRLAKVPVEVAHAAGTRVVEVNQQSDGGKWNHLGTFDFGPSATITVRSLGIGSTCADAVRLVPTSAPPPPTGEIVVDNGDPGTSSAGSWYVSGAPDPWEETSVYTRQGGAAYTFLVAVPEPSNYEVWLWWTEWPSRSRSVRVDIDDTGGGEPGQTIHVDQLSGGGRWNEVAVARFETTARIVVRGSYDGSSTCADAVKLVPCAPVPVPSAAILDDGQPGTTSTGSWAVSGGPDPYGGRSLYSKQAGATYAFRYRAPEPGTYEVQVWWTVWPSRDTAVPLTVDTFPGQRSFTVNQQTDGGAWNALGAFSVEGDIQVTIRSRGVGTACADAVRFVRK